MAQSEPADLALRLRSACILAPPVAAAAYFGPPWFEIVVLGVAMLMVREWTRMCGAAAPAGWTLAAGVLAGAFAVRVAAPPAAAVAVVLALCAVPLARLRRNAGDALVFALGGLSVVPFAAAFLWLRSAPADGRELVLGLLFAVWCTDIGAFVAGRTVGGPRLAPRVSPGKTWAGLAGGALCAAACGWLWVRVTGIGEPGPAIAVAVAIALFAQAGDLAVSAAKRRCGVKDSGNLIPGHGGVLDRADGMLLTGPLAVALVAVAGKA